MKTILLFLLLPLKLFSQDITGIWAGSLYNDTTRSYILYELAISEEKGKLSGYSHTTFMIDGIPNEGVKLVKIIRKKNQLFIEDVALLYNNYSVSPAKGVHQISLLTIIEHDSGMVLSGSWKTNRTREYSSVTGHLKLEKKKNFEESMLVQQLAKMNLVNNLSFIQKRPDEIVMKKVPPVIPVLSIKNNEPAAELTSRKIENIETVFFNSDSLVLTLYDNGEVDGDTVTVLMNGKVIWPKQMLTEKGINKTIHIPASLDSVQLIMYAENLGTIPPNTGLLVVRDGGKDYEIRFSGDLQKNAAITLKRRRK